MVLWTENTTDLFTKHQYDAERVHGKERPQHMVCWYVCMCAAAVAARVVVACVAAVWAAVQIG